MTVWFLYNYEESARQLRLKYLEEPIKTTDQSLDIHRHTVFLRVLDPLVTLGFNT